jgi:hypothetical protein
MKRLFATGLLLTSFSALLVGCEKPKAEVKQETTVTTPEGTTTETQSHSVETDKK